MGNIDIIYGRITGAARTTVKRLYNLRKTFINACMVCCIVKCYGHSSTTILHNFCAMTRIRAKTHYTCKIEDYSFDMILPIMLTQFTICTILTIMTCIVTVVCYFLSAMLVNKIATDSRI